jgi:hypothetical protein
VGPQVYHHVLPYSNVDQEHLDELFKDYPFLKLSNSNTGVHKAHANEAADRDCLAIAFKSRRFQRDAKIHFGLTRVVVAPAPRNLYKDGQRVHYIVRAEEDDNMAAMVVNAGAKLVEDAKDGEDTYCTCDYRTCSHMPNVGKCVVQMFDVHQSLNTAELIAPLRHANVHRIVVAGHFDKPTRLTMHDGWPVYDQAVEGNGMYGRQNIHAFPGRIVNGDLDVVADARHLDDKRNLSIFVIMRTTAKFERLTATDLGVSVTQLQDEDDHFTVVRGRGVAAVTRGEEDPIVVTEENWDKMMTAMVPGRAVAIVNAWAQEGWQKAAKNALAPYTQRECMYLMHAIAANVNKTHLQDDYQFKRYTGMSSANQRLVEASKQVVQPGTIAERTQRWRQYLVGGYDRYTAITGGSLRLDIDKYLRGRAAVPLVGIFAVLAAMKVAKVMRERARRSENAMLERVYASIAAAPRGIIVLAEAMNRKVTQTAAEAASTAVDAGTRVAGPYFETCTRLIGVAGGLTANSVIEEGLKLIVTRKVKSIFGPFAAPLTGAAYGVAEAMLYYGTGLMPLEYLPVSIAVRATAHAVFTAVTEQSFAAGVAIHTLYNGVIIVYCFKDAIFLIRDMNSQVANLPNVAGAALKVFGVAAVVAGALAALLWYAKRHPDQRGDDTPVAFVDPSRRLVYQGGRELPDQLNGPLRVEAMCPGLYHKDGQFRAHEPKRGVISVLWCQTNTVASYCGCDGSCRNAVERRWHIQKIAPTFQDDLPKWVGVPYARAILLASVLFNDDAIVSDELNRMHTDKTGTTKRIDQAKLTKRQKLTKFNIATKVELDSANRTDKTGELKPDDDFKARAIITGTDAELNRTAEYIRAIEKYRKDVWSHNDEEPHAAPGSIAPDTYIDRIAKRVVSKPGDNLASMVLQVAASHEFHASRNDERDALTYLPVKTRSGLYRTVLSPDGKAGTPSGHADTTMQNTDKVLVMLSGSLRHAYGRVINTLLTRTHRKYPDEFAQLQERGVNSRVVRLVQRLAALPPATRCKWMGDGYTMGLILDRMQREAFALQQAVYDLFADTDQTVAVLTCDYDVSSMDTVSGNLSPWWWDMMAPTGYIAPSDQAYEHYRAVLNDDARGRDLVVALLERATPGVAIGDDSKALPVCPADCLLEFDDDMRSGFAAYGVEITGNARLLLEGTRICHQPITRSLPYPALDAEGNQCIVFAPYIGRSVVRAGSILARHEYLANEYFVTKWRQQVLNVVHVPMLVAFYANMIGQLLPRTTAEGLAKARNLYELEHVKRGSDKLPLVGKFGPHEHSVREFICDHYCITYDEYDEVSDYLANVKLYSKLNNDIIERMIAMDANS